MTSFLFLFLLTVVLFLLLMLMGVMGVTGVGDDLVVDRCQHVLRGACKNSRGEKVVGDLGDEVFQVCQFLVVPGVGLANALVFSGAIKDMVGGGADYSSQLWEAMPC